MKKKDIGKSVDTFKEDIDQIKEFVGKNEKTHSVGGSERVRLIAHFKDSEKSLIFDLAIIKLYVAFEGLMLDCLIATINQDPNAFSKYKGVKFGHLNVATVEYLITGNGFFDFRGRDGLLETIKKNLSDEHWLYELVKQQRFLPALKKLSALRNLAAHDSNFAKRKALEAVGQQRIGSAGSWLKKQSRFDQTVGELSKLADDIKATSSK